ncbi:MAG: hypothetical protein FWG91_12215 [Lachnospiraceae bacterium]|nr:hypothetical protein [Lachnospiraceae bacterium]
MIEQAQKTSKQNIVDILIIVLSFAVVYGIAGIVYSILQLDLGKSLLEQTIMGACVQFGTMGLGICIVCAIRKDTFASFGLNREKLLLTILLSALACLPSLIFRIYQQESLTYLPFQGVHFTRPLLDSAFPVNVIGLLIIATAWGFFEGFYYVVLYDRINKLLPAKNVFLNWGAIICGIYCLLIHIVVGHTYGIEAIGVFAVIYGMLLTYRYTGNAWGCILIYCLYWNAIA